ncbi:Nucleoporin Nup37 [Amphibalanus amphitrite]|nr:Nucleoporin Nup37 [Amphibalanus amphitrite]KAF0308446.1 Nucleoporin Nup37 [Amphibalanus amphitrite]
MTTHLICCRRLEWLSADQLVSYHTLSLLHKVRRSGEPEELAAGLATVAEARGRDRDVVTRQDHLLHVPRCRTEMGRRRFQCRGPAAYNALPPDLPRLPPHLFGCRLRRHLREDSETGKLQHVSLHEFHHDSRVRCLAWSGETNLAEVPRCLKFAAAGADHCVRVYVHTGPTEGGSLEVHPLVGHTDYINDLSFGGPDGDTLASVGDDLTCRLWNAADFTPLACIASDGPCMSVCWHAEEQYQLLVAAASGTVTFYNTETRAPVSALHTGVTGLAGADWSPLDSLRVATVHDSRLVTLDVSRLSKPETDQEVHHGGGQKVRFSRTAKQHVATCSLTQVKVTQLGVHQAPLAEDLMAVGGISWHSVLPYLLAGSDRKLVVWRVALI